MLLCGTETWMNLGPRWGSFWLFSLLFVIRILHGSKIMVSWSCFEREEFNLFVSIFRPTTCTRSPSAWTVRVGKFGDFGMHRWGSSYFHDERISSTLSSPFPSTSSSPHPLSISCSPACTSSTTLRAVFLLRTSPKKRWSLLTSLTSPQVMSPCPTTSWRLMSSPSQSPWPNHISPSNGSSRMWITMTPRSRRCFITHTEYMSITPSEKACLSVSRRRPCPSERGDPLWRANRATLLWQVVRS